MARWGNEFASAAPASRSAASSRPAVSRAGKPDYFRFDQSSLRPPARISVFFAWLRDVAPHDLGVRALAAATFLALAGLGRSVIDLEITPIDSAAANSDAAGSRMATTGRLLIVAGLFGALAQLVELGGHQAAIAASSSQAPAASIGLIQFFVDQVGAAIATCAWAVFGAAAFAGALATRSWFAVPGVALGAALVVMVASRPDVTPRS